MQEAHVKSIEITENTVVTLELTVREINLVLAGLLETPARTANPLLTKITEQSNAFLEVLKTTPVREGNEINLNLEDSVNSKEHFN